MKRPLLDELKNTGCFIFVFLCLSPSPSVSESASSGGAKRSSAVRLLIEIVRRDNDERVGRDERTPWITDF